MAKTYKSDGAMVRWYGEEVQLLIEEATADGLEAAAFEVEGLARQNIVGKDLIDTSFMMNSLYAKGHTSSSYGPKGKPKGKAYALPEQQLSQPLEALTAVAASYGIWPELKFGYLYPALESVASQLGGHLVKAHKEKGF